MEKVSKYGFDGYLRKPVILDDLIEELAKYLKYQALHNDIKEENNNKIIDLEKLKVVVNKLEKEFKEEWLNIKDGGDFSLIEEFAVKLNELALKEEIYLLDDYSKELIKNVEFDLNILIQNIKAVIELFLSKEDRSAINRDRVDELFNQLEKLLNELDSDALIKANELQVELEKIAYFDELDNFMNYVNDFDFDKADEYLKLLREKIPKKIK